MRRTGIFRTVLLSFLLIAFTVLSGLLPALAQDAARPTVGHVRVHGSGGRPVVLLEGRVIALEQPAHGRPAADAQLADDTAAALRQRGVEQADVYAHGVGGGVALQLAIRHPTLVHRLVVQTSERGETGFLDAR